MTLSAPPMLTCRPFSSSHSLAQPVQPMSPVQMLARHVHDNTGEELGAEGVVVGESDTEQCCEHDQFSNLVPADCICRIEDRRDPMKISLAHSLPIMGDIGADMQGSESKICALPSALTTIERMSTFGKILLCRRTSCNSRGSWLHY